MPHKDPAVRKAWAAEYRRLNAEKLRQKNAEYRSTHAEKIKKYADAHREERKALCRKWYSENRERALHYASAYLAANREAKALYMRNYRSDPKKYAAAKSVDLKRRYGLSGACVANLLQAQNAVCALCGRPFDDKVSGDNMCVDHCHASGKVRGLLHRRCNSAIGLLGDSSVLAERAAAYLRKGGVVEDIFA